MHTTVLKMIHHNMLMHTSMHTTCSRPLAPPAATVRGYNILLYAFAFAFAFAYDFSFGRFCYRL